ncbi:MAG: hypothetical protein E7160_00635 [Firmicutes bacterium]|nr:hypothetical protein [Bacillota bacterium]
MTLLVLLNYIIFSVILFICISYLKKKYLLNTTNTIIFTNILLILLAGLYKDNTNIFIVVVFMFIIDMLYTTYLLGEDFFKDNRKNITNYFILIITSYLNNMYFINQVDNIFPKDSEPKIIVWLLVILFLYDFFKENNVKEETTPKRVINNKEYIVMNFAKFKSRYQEDIKLENKKLTNIVYSIMIYENYNRPLIIRKIDTTKFKFVSKPTKLGIMQIESKKLIDDIDSIELACKKLDRIYNRKLKLKKKDDIINSVVKDYYKDEIKEENILTIYEIINNFLSE